MKKLGKIKKDFGVRETPNVWYVCRCSGVGPRWTQASLDVELGG